MTLRKLVRRTAAGLGVVVALAASGLVVAYWMSDNDCAERRAAVPAHPMTAILYCDYGAPEVLTLEDVEKPTPGDGQVLVRVRAAAVNPLELHYMRGTPYVMRLQAGLFEPEDPKVGVDVAGRVVAVGSKVTRFKPGDEVFGTAPGALAQYALATDTKLVHKPANLSFEQAAAVPVAALTALQGLRDKGRARSGDTVLINGASGGVGTFAVQIARTMGLHVTGVCSGRNVARVRALGAQHVIDYTREDFTRGNARYDIVLDLVGNRGLLEVRRVLEPGGRYVLIGGGGPNDGRCQVVRAHVSKASFEGAPDG
jgi:NADPH:quinone reductase-like Zn-dependent oxidoreductase